MVEKHFFKTIVGTLHPDKIVIQTRNLVSQYMTYGTDAFSILSPDCSDEELGIVILRHLDLSQETIDNLPHFGKQRKGFLKKTGFKTEKEFSDTTRYATVMKTIDSLRFRPYQNQESHNLKGQFLGLMEVEIEIYEFGTFEIVGNTMRVAWTMCTFG